ncbi:MAG TPA: SDR family oxidoreductase [Vicinamibacterales bacterium]|nr:SDR family oxidoreductase [Vicinamibacterales bacterium]
MSRTLEGCHAVVTGAGRGLGRAIAQGLAEAGACVSICARTESELEKTAGEIRARGGCVESAQVDLSDPAACDRFVASVFTRTTHVDVLVNNAAVLQLAPLEQLSPEVWVDTIAINLTAPCLLIKAFLPSMRQHGGSIINVSSRAGVLGFANETAYCASKFGLEGFTRALALELEGAPVSVNTVTPGLRIKPTSITDADIATGETHREQWEDPRQLIPAFLFLARLRGEISGLRFDANRLSRALDADPVLTVARAKDLAE